LWFRLAPIGPQPEKNRQAALRRTNQADAGISCAGYTQQPDIWWRPMRAMVLWVMLALLCACSRTPDEQRIRESITAMQQAMEERNPRTFLAYVSEDFIGNGADFDRAALASLLRIEVFRNDQVGVMLGPIDIDLQGDRATARLTATFTGGSCGLFPEHGAIYDITSGWKRDAGKWVCYSGRWEQKL
jgi:hypothetical protein